MAYAADKDTVVDSTSPTTQTQTPVNPEEPSEQQKTDTSATPTIPVVDASLVVTKPTKNTSWFFSNLLCCGGATD